MAYERKTSDIYITPEFKKVIELFADKSEYANLLLKKRLPKDILQDDHINYFDKSQSEPTKISYLTSDRIEKISQSDVHDFWTTSRRYKGNPGAFLNKVFKNVPGREVENFATFWKTFAVEKEFTFKVVEGEDLRKYYHQKYHHKCEGTLENSCMKYPKCQKYLDFYVDNGVKMLVMFFRDTEEVIGRALLWETTHKGSVGEKVMDRVYTIADEEYLNHFIKWADDNGYIHKTYQNWYSGLQFTNKNSENEFKIDIKLNKVYYEYFPYLDTFKFLDLDSMTISNYCSDHDDFERFKCLSSPNGGWENPNYLRLDDISREYCHSHDLVRVLIAHNNEIWTTSSNCNYSNIYNRWILKAESSYLRDIEDYIYIDPLRNNQDLINSKITWINERKKENESSENRRKSILDNLYDWSVTYGSSSVVAAIDNLEF